jgi:two-component system response regulator AgrA
MLLTKGQAEVPVFQIWNQPFKTLRVYAKNKVFDCLGTLKDYEKRYPSLVPADRQSLINLDAVQNYDEKKGIAYFDQGVVHSVAVHRRRSVMLKLNATKNDLA